MKRVLSVLLVIFISQIAISQVKCSDYLKKYINQNNRDLVDVIVIGNAKMIAIDDVKSTGQSFSDFQKSYVNELNNTEKSTVLLMKELLNEDYEVEVLHQFWFIDAVGLKVNRQTLLYLSNSEKVDWIEAIAEKPAIWVEPTEMNLLNNKSPNGVETGIRAVKGDSLWQLGYSGKGSKLLTFDTGVWPSHPTFRDQFLGAHVPLEQAWFGFDTFFPGDKPGSHGTHVTGTCLGIDPSTNDTIGLGYNAYFMATDPIVESLADLKTNFDIFRAYEWAMNPDGDLNTTDDIPDVINNSWGRPNVQGDTSACGGWVSDGLEAIENAGIISIHSAGNSGPGAGTVGFPALSNSSPVNNFAVGAVNGNNPSFPIADFSSRGPTVCGGVGTLAIKPEIVAPGVGVRSSIRNADGSFGYSSFNGTSMAAPHVSGVSLLLREAFPNATATEIKEAMFYSAIDLGAGGEDNTYGMGMLDAMEAYRYLETLYTPFNPIQGSFDIHLTGFDVKEFGSYCDLQTVKLYVQSSEIIDATNVSVVYGFYSGWKDTLNLTGGNLQMLDSIDVPIMNNDVSGWNEFYAEIIYSGTKTDIDPINNKRFVRYWKSGDVTLPYSENFNTKHVFESSMYVGNPDERMTWDSITVNGFDGETVAAFMNLERYSPSDFQYDYLETPKLEVSGNDSLFLYFDVSYQLRFNGFRDSLLVWVSEDCGNSWGTPIYVKGPEELNSTTKPSAANWVPVDSNDWRHEVVSLKDYTNKTNIMVRFGSVNGKGNNLYLDNINVYGDQGPLSIRDLEEISWVMYPNPNDGRELFFNHQISGAIYNLSGSQIITFENRKTISISSLTPGVYLVFNQDSMDYRKLVVL